MHDQTLIYLLTSPPNYINAVLNCYISIISKVMLTTALRALVKDSKKETIAKFYVAKVIFGISIS